MLTKPVTSVEAQWTDCREDWAALAFLIFLSADFIILITLLWI